MNSKNDHQALDSRRGFLKTTAVAIGAGAATHLSVARAAHAAEQNTLKIGLVGCGGRGTGAAAQALTADPSTKLIAVADAFRDRAENSLKAIRGQKAEQVDVPPDRIFDGFEGYQKVIDSGVDIVLLTSSTTASTWPRAR